MKNFGRQIRLYLGSEQESIEVSPLRITFEIIKALTAEPNPAKISICNLNPNNREALLSKQYNKAILSVGYHEVHTIYAGDIITAEQRNEDVDHYIDLTCGDGYNDFKEARINTTLRAGASEQDVLREALKTMPRTEQGMIGLPVNRSLPRGKVLVGQTRDILHTMAKNNQANWFVDNGSLVILPVGSALASDEGYVLSKDTGMIGAPERTDGGLKVTCLLNPKIVIGSLIRVESINKRFNGDYKVTELIHRGDMMGDEWYTEITCTGGEFQKV